MWRRTLLLSVIGLFLVIGAVPYVQARTLTFEERVAAQRAIEQVYWNHRIWPKDNPGPKPPLSTVLSDEAIRAKVEDYLKKSNALEKWWQRPITAEQLQAEMDRMTVNTRDSNVLHELFAALGNDPQIIAETLARQTLADRLIRNWYAFDSRFHGDTKKKAQGGLATCHRAGCMSSMGGVYREATWKLRGEGAMDATEGAMDFAVRLDADEWWHRANRLAKKLGGPLESLPSMGLSPLEEAADRFAVTAVLDVEDGEIKIATTTWQKRSFDTWWGNQRETVGSHFAESRAPFELRGTALTACTDDTWAPTYNEVPDGRSAPAVWTGTEMIVWGGYDGNELDTGGRYNPSTDSWVATSTGADAPTARSGHTAVWTGSELIVWGGYTNYGNTAFNTGGRYNPSTDTWVATSTGANVPTARSGHTAVWTGSEMIVWGGGGNTGGRYEPASNTWVPVSTGEDVPTARSGHTAVWTGSEMIIWGGSDGNNYLNTGARYDPAWNSWIPMSTGGSLPAGRMGHTAVWTGSQMIVWGGFDGDVLNTGGRYKPSTDGWVATSTEGSAPVARYLHTAVWTGTEMVVWGGHNYVTDVNSGGRYNPSADSWALTSTGANLPEARSSHAAVWTGNEMIVWGGGNTTSYLNTGGRYDPSEDSWVATSTEGSAPAARDLHTSVWTGAEMIIWGGTDGTADMGTGARYDPSTDSWITTSTGASVPVARAGHTAVWTGVEMIVWGGYGATGALNTGGRYSPSTDSWAATSTGLNVPVPRSRHTAVWTGTEMIVWGGSPLCCVGTGGRYNPSADTWQPTSMGANAPVAHVDHTAVWTGAEMIIWGGVGIGGATASGSRYDPSTDSWTYVANCHCDGRSHHTAVWTGTEMIVWGGYAGGRYLNTGMRYDPSTDSWALTSTGANVPTGRENHTAVWTGTDMIVWGGENGPYFDTKLNTGGRYDPSTNTWLPTSTGPNVPAARMFHSAVWTGTEMIVWGGQPLTSTGGRYCANSNCTVSIWYSDKDGDGVGMSTDTVLACVQPSGYAAGGGDCNDSDPLAWGRPVEVNDVRLAKPEAGVAGLEWNSQAGGAGSETVYDVVSGVLGELRSMESFGAATCIGDKNPTSSYEDRRSGPDPAMGWYYLVRAANSCGTGSYGDSSMSPDSRDALDVSSPCP